jgi:hypothetical protein
MSKSTSGGTQTIQPLLSPQQAAMLQAQTGMFTGTTAPAMQQAITGQTNLYNTEAGGVTQAAQNLAGTAAQAQNVLGSGGESAYNTGISGLENLYSPQYQAQQLQAALQPGEAQYAQNIANQQAQFGGAGQLGSARSALAQAQTAGATQAAQQQAAATVMNNITTQQQNAANSLLSAGQSGLTGAQSAAQNQITAAMAPQQLYNQYASVLYGQPSSSYSGNYSGTIGSTGTQSGYGTQLNSGLTGLTAGALLGTLL